MSSFSTAKMKTYGETTSSWGTPCSRIILLVNLPPHEDVCLSAAQKEADPLSDRLDKVEHFQTVIYVLVGQTIEGFLEINQEN